MNLREAVARLAPDTITGAFAAGNLGFLAVDIFIAHAANGFAARAEWIPISFSLAAPVMLIPVLVARGSRPARLLAILVGIASIAVGVAGMVYHLESGFFERQTIHRLVYTAPFVAPLSYVGLGLLVLLDRMEIPGSRAWAEWVVLLALGGFIGNLSLSLLDHAQNGFFSALEWVAVIAAAFGSSFLLVALLRPSLRFLRACGGVMALEVAVGLLGAALHTRADWHAPAASLRDRFLYGAPVFAPLLFADLALLAVIGLWSLAAVTEPTA